MAILVNPEVQTRAQEELDRVVGPNRLPAIEDKDKLPYVAGIALEAMRWNPVIPLGLAHKVIADDEYNGMRIPKNTTVLPNVWFVSQFSDASTSCLSVRRGILHDEENYPDPMSFKPERYYCEPSRPGVNSYPSESFGFGRRYVDI